MAGTSGISTTTPQQPPVAGAPAASQIAVSGSEFSFSPNDITVTANQPVQLTFTNTGQYPHNLSIPDLNITIETIDPNQLTTVTFTPTATGQFPIYCTVPGHADNGMQGTLTVQ